MVKVRVDRSQWLRGERCGSRLYRVADEKMCCLGFVCVALGIRQSEIADMVTPAHVNNTASQQQLLRDCGLVTLNGGNTCTCAHLMSTNDHPELSDGAREAKIKELGQEIGIEFCFED